MFNLQYLQTKHMLLVTDQSLESEEKALFVDHLVWSTSLKTSSLFRFVASEIARLFRLFNCLKLDAMVYHLTLVKLQYFYVIRIPRPLEN